jgi:hypothetical protein
MVQNSNLDWPVSEVSPIISNKTHERIFADPYLYVFVNY